MFRPKNIDVSGNMVKKIRVGRLEIFCRKFVYGVNSGPSMHFAYSNSDEAKNCLRDSCHKILGLVAGDRKYS